MRRRSCSACRVITTAITATVSALAMATTTSRPAQPTITTTAGRILTAIGTAAAYPTAGKRAMRGVDRRTTLVGLTALLMGQASGRASEDAYPSRDVRII